MLIHRIDKGVHLSTFATRSLYAQTHMSLNCVQVFFSYGCLSIKTRLATFILLVDIISLRIDYFDINTAGSADAVIT
jgi:hypothetical protein